MGDFAPIFAAIVTTVIAITTGVIATRKLTAIGFGGAQSQVNATLRELTAVEQEKRKIVEQERDALRQMLADTRHDLDDCARQRDAAWADARRRRTNAQ